VADDIRAIKAMESAAEFQLFSHNGTSLSIRVSNNYPLCGIITYWLTENKYLSYDLTEKVEKILNKKR
jgi:hypothetical protein